MSLNTTEFTYTKYTASEVPSTYGVFDPPEVLFNCHLAIQAVVNRAFKEILNYHERLKSTFWGILDSVVYFQAQKQIRCIELKDNVQKEAPPVSKALIEEKCELNEPINRRSSLILVAASTSLAMIAYAVFKYSTHIDQPKPFISCKPVFTGQQLEKIAKCIENVDVAQNVTNFMPKMKACIQDQLPTDSSCLENHRQTKVFLRHFRAALINFSRKNPNFSILEVNNKIHTFSLNFAPWMQQLAAQVPKNESLNNLAPLLGLPVGTGTPPLNPTPLKPDIKDQLPPSNLNWVTKFIKSFFNNNQKALVPIDK